MSTKSTRVPRRRQADQPSPACFPPCACGNASVTLISAELLNGVVIVAIGACQKHEPADDAAAHRMIVALLAGIAKAGNEAATNSARRPRRRARRA